MHPSLLPVQLLHSQLQRARALGQRSHLRSSGFTPGGGAPSAKLVWAAMTIPRLPCPSTSTCLDIVTGPAPGTSPTVRRTARVFTPSLTCRQGRGGWYAGGRGQAPRPLPHGRSRGRGGRFAHLGHGDEVDHTLRVDAERLAARGLVRVLYEIAHRVHVPLAAAAPEPLRAHGCQLAVHRHTRTLGADNHAAASRGLPARTSHADCAACASLARRGSCCMQAGICDNDRSTSTARGLPAAAAPAHGALAHGQPSTAAGSQVPRANWTRARTKHAMCTGAPCMSRPSLKPLPAIHSRAAT